MLDIVTLDETLKNLFEEVRLSRKGHRTCLSAQDNQNLGNLISKIIEEHTFEYDYNRITVALLFETVTYEDSIEKMKRLASFITL